MVLTAGSLAQNLDASLCVTLGFLQLTLIGVGGWIWAANRCHQGWTVQSLANTLSRCRVSWVTLTYSAKTTQHSSTACKTGIERGGIRIALLTSDLNIVFVSISSPVSSKLPDHKPTQCIVQLNSLMSVILTLHLSCMNWLSMHKLKQSLFSLISPLLSWVNAKKVNVLTPDRHISTN